MEEESFSRPEIVKLLFSDFIPIRVDVDKEKKIASTYHVKGLPVSWFLEPDGGKILTIPGYVNPDLFQVILKYVSSESYKKMTLKEFMK
jgi:thioredoxin-related protein